MAAACVSSLLESAAKAKAWSGKMPTLQGTYVQNWTLSGVAISYLKVRQSGQGTKEQDAAIQKWFAAMAAQVRAYFDAGASNPKSDAWNNHIYWAGLAVAAEGIAANDAKAFRWGMDTYKGGVDSIQLDGSLVAEMYREQMAPHYHLYALGPLILLAEFGETNGMHLYAEDDGAIHRLVKLCTSGLEYPTIFEKRVGVKQVVSQPYEGETLGGRCRMSGAFRMPRWRPCSRRLRGSGIRRGAGSRRRSNLCDRGISFSFCRCPDIAEVSRSGWRQMI